MGFDVEALARLIRRPCRWRKENGAGELRRPFDQPDKWWRILRHANELNLVTIDSELGNIGAIGQSFRKRFQYDDT